MNEQFDELAKALAQGVSRREALRLVAGGLAGALLASLGYQRAWAGSVDCGQFCGARFNARTAKKQFGKCAVSCDDCQAGGGTPCSASRTMGTVTCCSSGQVCQAGQCVSPLPVCTAGFEVAETGTCSGSNATCACPEGHYCCQGTGASANLYQCCETGYHIACDYGANGEPICVS
jgi:hypothetical protein